MGTLFNQSPRTESAFGYTTTILKEVKQLSEDNAISMELAFKIVELAVKINDLDIKDEQLAGFGQIFQGMLEIMDEKLELEH